LTEAFFAADVFFAGAFLADDFEPGALPAAAAFACVFICF
jgi:hypothetical protein